MASYDGADAGRYVAASLDNIAKALQVAAQAYAKWVDYKIRTGK